MSRVNSDQGTSTLRVLMYCMVLLGFLAASSAVFAQSSNGQITGLVTDQSGAAIQDANITATNTATGVTYSGTSNGAGVYVLPQLVPGPYKVTLTKDGFATVERSEVTVELLLKLRGAVNRSRARG